MSITPAHNAALVQELEIFLRERKTAILATEDRLRILNEEVQSLEATIAFATRSDGNSIGTPHHQPPSTHVTKSKSTFRDPFPLIHKCPNEILCMIFEFSLLYDHTRIRELLLVCRRWNHFIMNAPRMWARIQFKVTDVLSPKIRVYSHYLDACMARSKPLLLNVEVDVQEFRTLPEYLKEEAMASIRMVADEEEWDDVFEWGISLDCHFSSAKFEVNFEEVWALLRSLTGEEGKNMARWRSLSLFLPPLDSFLASDIWELFVGPTPHLSRLEVNGIDGMFDILDDPVLTFPDLTSLRSLAIMDSCDPLVLEMDPGSLEQLQIYFGPTLVTIRPLSLFTSLQFLVLKYFGGAIDHPSEPVTISLPCLKSLTFIGRWGGLTALKFSLPSHEILILESSEGFEELPLLYPRTIRWKILFGRHKVWSCVAIENAIIRMLYISDCIETLLIHESATEALIKVLPYLEESYLLPPTLRSVKSVDDYGSMSENLLPVHFRG